MNHDNNPYSGVYPAEALGELYGVDLRYLRLQDPEQYLSELCLLEQATRVHHSVCHRDIQSGPINVGTHTVRERKRLGAKLFFEHFVDLAGRRRVVRGRTLVSHALPFLITVAVLTLAFALLVISCALWGLSVSDLS